MKSGPLWKGKIITFHDYVTTSYIFIKISLKPTTQNPLCGYAAWGCPFKSLLGQLFFFSLLINFLICLCLLTDFFQNTKTKFFPPWHHYLFLVSVLASGILTLPASCFGQVCWDTRSPTSCRCLWCERRSQCSVAKAFSQSQRPPWVRHT